MAEKDKESPEEAFAEALVLALADMPNPAKDAVNPYFKSEYATLHSVRETIVPVFAKNGIAVTQEITGEAGTVSVETVLLHESGLQRKCGKLSVKLGADCESNAQAVGSFITYLRRYSLCAVAGVVGEHDDDAEGVSGHEKPAIRQSEAKGPAKPAATPALKPAPKPASKAMANTHETTIEIGAVKSKTGGEPDKEWTRWYTKGSDGQWYSTFDKKVGAAMETLAESEVSILYKQEERGRSVLHIASIREEPEVPGEQETTEEEIDEILGTGPTRK